MLISHRKRFIYLKTRKTAGTSVLAYLTPYCVLEGESVPKPRLDSPAYVSAAGVIGGRIGADAEHGTWRNHLPASQVRERLAVTWDSYTKICCIRNPFDKVFSYFWWENPHFGSSNPNFADIKAAFRHWLLNNDDMAYDRQMYAITDDAPCLDYYIRYENLSESLGEIFVRLEIPFVPGDLTWKKGRSRPRGLPFPDFYDCQTADRVLATYDREFDWFSYSRDYRQ